MTALALLAEYGFGPGYGRVAAVVVGLLLILSAVIGEILGRRDTKG